MMKNPGDLDLVNMIHHVRKKELSPLEIIESCLEAVSFYNDELKAFISIDGEKIRAQARLITESGLGDASMLSCMPIAIKDLIDVKGEVTTNGSSFFKKVAPAKTDAPVIRRLRKNGAVIFGKTNLHEFAWGGTTENPHFGICRNPWNPDHSAGGSSGGSGAAVASGMAPAALGTDTLGSIRIPSSFCGIVGLKPTYGLLPTDGIFPLGYTFDHVGPMARSVSDVELLFRALIEPEDRKRLGQKGTAPKMAPEGSGRLKGLRIGILPDMVPEEACDKTVYRQYRRAFEFARDEGAEVVEEKIPGFENALFAGFLMTLSQAAEIHHQRLSENPDGFGRDVRDLLESGHMIPAVEYVRAQRIRAKLVHEAKALMKRIDAWILPTTPVPAPKIGGSTDANLAMFTGPVNVIGFPAIALPSGLSAEGLPVSIQIVGAPHQDLGLLKLAKIFEDRFGFPKDLPAMAK